MNIHRCQSLLVFLQISLFNKIIDENQIIYVIDSIPYVNFFLVFIYKQFDIEFLYHLMRIFDQTKTNQFFPQTYVDSNLVKV